MIKAMSVRFVTGFRQFLRRNFLFNEGADHSRSTHLTYIAILGFMLVAPFLISFDLSGGKDEAGALRLWKIRLPTMCSSKRIFGVDCPGCGLTRSFVALTHGKWRLALCFHRLGPFLYAYFILLILFHLYGLHLKNRPLPVVLARIHTVSALCVIIALLLNWVLVICAL